MWSPELVRNKLYALLLIACTLPVIFMEGDATATVFVSMIAVPMFFARENWILGGCHESQKSRRQDIRRRNVRCREKSHGFGDPAPACRVRPEASGRNRRHDPVGAACAVWIWPKEAEAILRQLPGLYQRTGRAVSDGRWG